jgi:hypothetical protein
MTATAGKYEGATYCIPCDATAAVVAVPGQAVRVLFEFEPDGYTVSPYPHVCWPRAERAARLIEQVRAALAAGAPQEDTDA